MRWQTRETGGAAPLQRGPCCSRGKIARAGRRRWRCCRFKEAPAVRGGRLGRDDVHVPAPDAASKRPLLFAGEDALVARLARLADDASKRPLLFAGEDPDYSQTPALRTLTLQRGPCCSRGKIQPDFAAGAGGGRASKRPLLFAGEDDDGDRGSDVRRHDASKRPLLFAGEDCRSHEEPMRAGWASKRPLLFAGEDFVDRRAHQRPAAASKRPLLFAGEDGSSWR